jgi:hypothetical protein
LDGAAFGCTVKFDSAAAAKDPSQTSIDDRMSGALSLIGNSLRRQRSGGSNSTLRAINKLPESWIFS